MGLFGGLLGWDTADERLPRSAEALNDAGIETERTVAVVSWTNEEGARIMRREVGAKA